MKIGGPRHALIDRDSDLGRNLETDLQFVTRKKLEQSNGGNVTISKYHDMFIDLRTGEKGADYDIAAQISGRNQKASRIMVLECRMNARGRLLVLLGKYTDTKAENSHLSCLTYVLWDSDTGLNGSEEEIHEKTRMALAHQLGKLDDHVRGATHVCKRDMAGMGRNYFDDAPAQAKLIDRNLLLPLNYYLDQELIKQLQALQQ